MPINHVFVNPLADEPGFAGTKPSDWNAAHTVSIVDADVAIAAAIAETKLALNYPTHAAVTLDANADTVLSLAAQALGLDTQTANTVFSGATSGGAAVPAFRALVAGDIPAPSAMAGGGFYNYVRPRRFSDDDDLAIALTMLELMDDD